MHVHGDLRVQHVIQKRKRLAVLQLETSNQEWNSKHLDGQATVNK